jgi:hypothetical protein
MKKLIYTPEDVLGRLERLVWCRRGGDPTRPGCVEHARSHEVPVRRLVARAYARDHGHPAFHRCVGP